MFESQPRQTLVVKIGSDSFIVLRDDHYEQMSRVTVGVARKKPSLLNRHECMLGICSNLQPFTGSGDVSIWVKNYRVGLKTPKKNPTKTPRLD